MWPQFLFLNCLLHMAVMTTLLPYSQVTLITTSLLNSTIITVLLLVAIHSIPVLKSVSQSFILQTLVILSFHLWCSHETYKTVMIQLQIETGRAWLWATPWGQQAHSICLNELLGWSMPRDDSVFFNVAHGSCITHTLVQVSSCTWSTSKPSSALLQPHPVLSQASNLTLSCTYPPFQLGWNAHEQATSQYINLRILLCCRFILWPACEDSAVWGDLETNTVAWVS